MTLESLGMYGGSGSNLGMSLFMKLFPHMAIYITLFSLLGLGVYIYLSLAYSKIGEKAKLNSPNIAWLPYGGIVAVVFESARMHWWPFLLLGFYYPLLIINSLFIGTFFYYLGSALLFIFAIVFYVMFVIWHWKTYKVIGKPGIWALYPNLGLITGFLILIFGFATKSSALIFTLIGVILFFLSFLLHLILVGIAAWSQTNPQISQTNPLNNISTRA